MKIVVFLDGSPESFLAAEFAITLARESKSSLLAQLIIDRKAIIALTGFQGYAGLCGSGVFIEAHDKIVEALKDLNESMLLSFCARAEGQGIIVASSIDEGSWSELIESRVSCDSIHVLTADMLPNKKVKCPSIVFGDKSRLEILGTGHLTQSLLYLLDVYFPALEVGLPRLMEVA